MERPGFESDRNRILVLDLESGEVTEPTAGLDQTVHGATWTADSKSFVFASEWRGTNQLFHLPLGGGEPRQLTEGQHNFGLVDLLPGGEALVSVMDMQRPRELAILSMDARPSAWPPTSTPTTTPTSPSRASRNAGSRPLTARRSTAGSAAGLRPREEVPPADLPPGGPKGNRPVVLYRWNFHLMAARATSSWPNRRGLPGFAGKGTTDQHGLGRPAMKDILSATDPCSRALRRRGSRRRWPSAATVYWLMGNGASASAR